MESLKRKATNRRAETFLRDLETRERDWVVNEAKILNTIQEDMLNEEINETSNGGAETPSVNLSDVKSENDSIYWK